MLPSIAHIAGPLYIRSYGLMIIIGLLLCIWLIERNARFKKLMNHQQLMNTITIAIIAGIIGGRSLYLVDSWHQFDHWYDVFALWQGGFSALGTVLAVSIAIPCHLYIQKIPILPTLDLFALYAPLLWSISRIGCFLAGCCYGTVCTLPWAVTFWHTDSLAPVGITLHPTQLYSSLVLFLIWIFMQWHAQYHFTKPGQLAFLFLGLASTERFIVDFWRAQRSFMTVTHTNLDQYVSLPQWIALGLIIVAGIGFYWVSTKRKET